MLISRKRSIINFDSKNGKEFLLFTILGYIVAMPVDQSPVSRSADVVRDLLLFPKDMGGWVV